jgi:hypothetical protein
MALAEQTRGARYCSHTFRNAEKKRAAKLRRLDEKRAIREGRDPIRRVTRGWAD